METTVNELVDFLLGQGSSFQEKLRSGDTVLGETKMSENWPVDVENLRAGLMKAAKDALSAGVTKLSTDFATLEKRGIDIHAALRLDEYRALQF